MVLADEAAAEGDEGEEVLVSGLVGRFLPGDVSGAGVWVVGVAGWARLDKRAGKEGEGDILLSGAVGCSFGSGLVLGDALLRAVVVVAVPAGGVGDLEAAAAGLALQQRLLGHRAEALAARTVQERQRARRLQW